MTSLVPLLALGALTSPLKRKVSPTTSLPTTRLTLAHAFIDHGQLAAYARICGFPCTDPLPLTYPHVIAFPLALRVMTRRAFPLPLTGLVHTSIAITRHRAMHPDDRPELTVYADHLSPHRRGTEVTMVTEARLAGALVWESRSTYLARHPTESKPGAHSLTMNQQHQPKHQHQHAPLPAVTTWDVSGNLGRRYGLVSGDLNPIHLHPLTAKLFGFPRAIAHGMWTFARCVAELNPADETSVRADFRAPVLLPAAVTYAAAGGMFQLRGQDGRIHLTGTRSDGSRTRCAR
ncbi:MaoC/PaaZ C-terminal domain-containing protein [Streptomyces sp. NPDC002994]|uniref:MaoC family dehydratase n=1 Tax=Streptomyces sp. NPDC002994 TaxID=3154441 RepID=UPI0033A7C72E